MLSILWLLYFALCFAGIVAVSFIISRLAKLIAQIRKRNRFDEWLSKASMIKLMAICFPIVCFLAIWIDRGNNIDGKNGSNYYRTLKGICYESSGYSPIPRNLRTTGSCGYLKNVDEASFVVLSKHYAKDSRHAWYGCEQMGGVDVASFDVDASGLARDRDWVYVGWNKWKVLDPKSAEFFMPYIGHPGLDWSFVRDCNYVYYRGQKTSIDRNTFRPLQNHYYADKNNIYHLREECRTIAPLRVKPENVVFVGDYIKNGSGIIWWDSVIVDSVEIYRFEDEDLTIGQCIINDMLFEYGKQILKDSIDVKNLRAYHYGQILADNSHVFFNKKPIDGIDAATFQQVEEGSYKHPAVFKDKNREYVMKWDAWECDYPFVEK